MKLIQHLIHNRMLHLLGGLAAAAGWYATRVEPQRYHVNHITLPLRDLPPAFDGYRIAHISDQHLGVPRIDALLPRVVAMVNGEVPDLIAMTGDLVTWSCYEGFDPNVTAPLADLHAPDGIWSVLGNHDYTAPLAVQDLLAARGITLLKNESRIITRGTDRLALTGLDSMVWGAPDLNAALADVPDSMPVILLMHEPDFAPAAAAYPNIRLQLSGHTHGGQITPLNRPLVLPQHGRNYARGLRPVRRMWLYVTTGTGTGRFVIRWRSRPEIALITLQRFESVQPVV